MSPCSYYLHSNSDAPFSLQYEAEITSWLRSCLILVQIQTLGLEFGKRNTNTFNLNVISRLTYSRSPLDNAFYCGRPDIVRQLLTANANIEYVNRRGWTPIPYMWDPICLNPHTIELLDICAGRLFDFWECQDLLGWTPLHRAAAFGCGKDIKKLTNVMNGRAAWDMATLDLRWRPLHCAVRFGNVSTFDVLVKDIMPCDWLGLVDLRGWNPLHLAAQSGSEELLFKIFKAGADPSVLSDASGISVPEGLENQELTPQMIAQQCGYQEIYENAWKAGGRKPR
jgi:ankyrin repeat protein